MTLGHRKQRYETVEPQSEWEESLAKACPMCGTSNDPNAQSCKYCGYLFEDFGSEGKSEGESSPATLAEGGEQSSTESFGKAPQDSDSFRMPSSSPGAPLFTVSKSLVRAIAPTIVYIILILLFTTATLFSVLSIGIIVFFIIIALLPVLLTPRRYEFYDDLLRIHKIIGRDSEVPYANIMVYGVPLGRRPRIFLSVAGRRRPMLIPGNPMNRELGQDLSQFLGKKLKKHDPQIRNLQQPMPSSDSSEPSDAPNDDAGSNGAEQTGPE